MTSTSVDKLTIVSNVSDGVARDSDTAVEHISNTSSRHTPSPKPSADAKTVKSDIVTGMYLRRSRAHLRLHSCIRVCRRRRARHSQFNRVAHRRQRFVANEDTAIDV
jgi:hypothetical protein